LFDYALGAIIEILRLKAGLLQGELAKASGISQAWVSRVERGVRSIGMSDLAAIASVLKTDIVTLTQLTERVVVSTKRAVEAIKPGALALDRVSPAGLVQFVARYTLRDNSLTPSTPVDITKG
jgi:transcriptional regulator with XRE-family HTH domain